MRVLNVILFCLAVLAPAMSIAGPRYVLVHGAWGTGAYWDPVAERLRAAGLDVVAPDLPLGDPGITMEDEAQAILAAMGEASEVILVAHSAGTRPATAAWDRARGKVVAAIWVEGIPPVPGASDIAVPPDERTRNWLAANAPGVLASGLMPVPADLWGPYKAVAKPQPLGPLLDAVRLIGGPLPRIPQLYVTADNGIPDWKRIAGLLRGAPGWTVATIPGGHDVARDAPDELARLIEGWAYR